MKPVMARVRFLFPILILFLITELWLLFLSYDSSEGSPNQLSENKVSVYQIKPDQRGGKAYKLTYLVQVPIDVYWKFKTDFNNEFLVSNKYIREHHFISSTDDKAVTEDKYANTPDVFFRWETTMYPDIHKLEFVLLNPAQCGQNFHYGFIQLESVAEGTMVTQVAYFDFWGASLWADYPWGGGMVDFLTYTAKWEQAIVLDLKNRYTDESSKQRGEVWQSSGG